MMIGIDGTEPYMKVDICIGEEHFTDEHIMKWADGNLEDIDFTSRQAPFIIEYLSFIIRESGALTLIISKGVIHDG